MSCRYRDTCHAWLLRFHSDRSSKSMNDIQMVIKLSSPLAPYINALVKTKMTASLYLFILVGLAYNTTWHTQLAALALSLK
jgi:hypothetical protein